MRPYTAARSSARMCRDAIRTAMHLRLIRMPKYIKCGRVLPNRVPVANARRQTDAIYVFSCSFRY